MSPQTRLGRDAAIVHRRRGISRVAFTDATARAEALILLAQSRVRLSVAFRASEGVLPQVLRGHPSCWPGHTSCWSSPGVRRSGAPNAPSGIRCKTVATFTDAMRTRSNVAPNSAQGREEDRRTQDARVRTSLWMTGAGRRCGTPGVSDARHGGGRVRSNVLLKKNSMGNSPYLWLILRKAAVCSANPAAAPATRGPGRRFFVNKPALAAVQGARRGSKRREPIVWRRVRAAAVVWSSVGHLGALAANRSHTGPRATRSCDLQDWLEPA